MIKSKAIHSHGILHTKAEPAKVGFWDKVASYALKVQNFAGQVAPLIAKVGEMTDNPYFMAAGKGLETVGNISGEVGEFIEAPDLQSKVEVGKLAMERNLKTLWNPMTEKRESFSTEYQASKRKKRDYEAQ